MLWIIPLIMFIISLVLYIHYFNSRKINKKLVKKQKYYSKTRFTSAFVGACRITFGLCVLTLVFTFTFYVIPHTNGTIKGIRDYEDLIEIYNDYYQEAPKEELHENAKEIAKSFKYNPQVEAKVEIHNKNIAYIEEDTLYLRKLNGEELKYSYKNEMTKTSIKLFGEFLLVAVNLDENSTIYVHSLEDLSMVEVLRVNGKIQTFDVIGNKVIVSVNHEINTYDAFLAKEKTGEEYKVEFDDIHYLPNTHFFQNITIVSINHELNIDLFSLCIGEYYLVELNDCIFIVTNSFDLDEKIKTHIYLYDCYLGFVSRKIKLDGYTYAQPELRSKKFVVSMVEKRETESMFNQYIVDSSLWVNKAEALEVNDFENGIILNVYGYSIYAMLQSESIEFVKKKMIDEIEVKHTFTVDLEEYEPRICEGQIFLSSKKHHKKVIEKLVITDEGFEIEQIYGSEELISTHLINVINTKDGNVFIFANSENIYILEKTEEKFVLREVVISVNIKNIHFIENELIIFTDGEILIYDILN